MREHDGGAQKISQLHISTPTSFRGQLIVDAQNTPYTIDVALEATLDVSEQLASALTS